MEHVQQLVQDSDLRLQNLTADELQHRLVSRAHGLHLTGCSGKEEKQRDDDHVYADTTGVCARHVTCRRASSTPEADVNGTRTHETAAGNGMLTLFHGAAAMLLDSSVRKSTNQWERSTV